MEKVILIGCGKSKLTTPSLAQDLYCGSLFVARRNYAELSGSPWLILSAKHGLIRPTTIIEPYDMTIRTLSEIQVASWALLQVKRLIDDWPNDTKLRGMLIEIHAGEDYAEPICQVLGAIGVSYSRPVTGLGQGKQLAWYAEKRTNRGW